MTTSSRYTSITYAATTIIKLLQLSVVIAALCMAFSVVFLMEQPEHSISNEIKLNLPETTKTSPGADNILEVINVLGKNSPMELEEGKVNFTRPKVSYIRDKDGKKIRRQKTISYYHCGPKLTSSTIQSIDTEIVLLHGSQFTKDVWKTSTILQNLCFKGNENPKEHGRMSVVALNLPPRFHENGFRVLIEIKHQLEKAKVLSGKPVVLVTPSGSGKIIRSLFPMSHTDALSARVLLKAWIPIASAVVMRSTRKEAFRAFWELGIPVLAINGGSDMLGKQITKILVDHANATGVEIKGRHACYLDSPGDFVDVIINYFQDLNSRTCTEKRKLWDSSRVPWCGI